MTLCCKGFAKQKAFPAMKEQYAPLLLTKSKTMRIIGWIRSAIFWYIKKEKNLQNQN